ncbi:sigma-54-dependent transcriptional regulator [Liquorilactobacillus satsumensis]|uniref:DNA translocase FtsK n=1 Tax=Liquorilactobacillus satsumensis DSM 16230 = JCM 12392 TaxID=1423801 RepID=A0A0R1V481_9LACO|nr:sigma-54-dependent transcriptional regulator [Liquorilactobacillus satsumensis]KRM00337.1 transcriptional regulator [Liquorilactobacillus satsumensis DSM 16230 = JCM 12392]MCP9328996.1 sigma 54-interacting transcriptional regulator [Liquorilactobacillus satsumensis]
MTRREKIIAYLTECKAVQQSTALTTNEIASALNIYRSNVSKELNQLVRAGIVSKRAGRPVRYWLGDEPRVLLDPFEKQKIEDTKIGFAAHTSLGEKAQKLTVPHTENVFENLVGSHDSLKNQVEQAKAALLYPPHGLNTLIIGPTGSGKTFFANTMHRFAAHKNIITKKELITFNCADYAHNPQLLLSHLFGYVKGAFTGANEDHEGLIQQAEGGMLFLDEVHRLPPEGQEMIFYFMDHGMYSRLGETAKMHHGDVRLICATTENPESSLLQTFVRRIPIVIQLPPFEQRTVREKLQLLERLLTLEANRIHKNIKLNEDVVQALLGSVTYGNVGQLKSNIQLVCAQGFLNSMQNEDEITLSFEQLPPNIKDGLSHLASDRHELGKLTRLLETTMIIKPDAKRGLPEVDSYELPYNLYDIIGDKAALLKDEGLDQTSINNFIMTDINLHMKSFYQRGKLGKTENRLNEIVDREVIDLTKKIRHFLQEQEGFLVRDNFIYAMSLHISSFIKRVQSGKPSRKISTDLVSMAHDFPTELALAKRVKEMIAAHYRFPIPDSESYYMAILLVSVHSDPKNGRVGIVVAAHGNSTASSMAQVVSQLLSVDNITYYDMPLEMNPKVALDGIATRVKKIDRGNGVLLLVDMGSLSTFSAKLTEKTGVKVKTIDMVTTAMVLEAARKTTLIDSNLATVYRDLREFVGYSHSGEKLKEKQTLITKSATKQKKAIVAICATGEGTARKIKELLDKILLDNLINDITVIPISLVKMDEQIKKIQEKYLIVATTGVVKPKVAAPFVSLKTLFQGGAENFVNLIEQLDEGQETNNTFLKHSKALTEETGQKYLAEYFTFLNPGKIIQVLWKYCDFINDKTNNTMSNAFRINLILHLGGALERFLTRSSMKVRPELLSQMKREKLYPLLEEANKLVQKKLNITLPEDEIYYILELFKTEQQKIAD